MGLLRENYLKKANDLYSRLIDEAEETEEETGEDESETVETEEDTTEENPEEESPEEETQEEVQPVEIYFDNLDEEIQKNLLGEIKKNLNASEDDEIAENKIREILSKKPLITLMAEEIVRKLNIDI